MDPYGLRRVVSPKGVLPQRAEVLDSSLPLGEDELSISVEALNVDAASFRQISDEVGGDGARIGERILAIVRARGKLHNPVTGSGGMLIGRVKAVGTGHPARDRLAVGDRVATLVSLTLTPLRLDEIRAVRTKVERIECLGEAILFASGLWAKLPSDLKETLALAVLDVCGAPALVDRHLRPGFRVLVLGAGKSGALVCARAKERLSGDGEVYAADVSEDALSAIRGSGLADRTLALDATNVVSSLSRLKELSGSFDLVVNCASVPGTEMTCLFAVKEGGTVIFFSMATSFTAAALGAEGIGKDVTILVGNGYVPGHAELALGLVRRNDNLRSLIEKRYGC